VVPLGLVSYHAKPFEVFVAMGTIRLLLVLLCILYVEATQVSRGRGEGSSPVMSGHLNKGSRHLQEEQKPAEQPKPEEQKPPEAPKPEEQKPPEAPKVEEQKPPEAPKPEEQKPPEAPKVEEQKPPEAPKPEEQKPPEAPKVEEQKPPEAPKPEEQKPAEQPKPEEQKPAEQKPPEVSEVDRLKQEVEQLKRERDDARRDATNANDDKRRLEEDKRRLEEEKKRAEDEKKHVEEDKNRIEEEKRRAEEAKKNAEDTKNGIENERNKLRDEKNAVEEEKRRLQQEKDQLAKEMQDVKDAFTKARQAIENPDLYETAENAIKAAMKNAPVFDDALLYLNSTLSFVGSRVQGAFVNTRSTVQDQLARGGIQLHASVLSEIIAYIIFATPVLACLSCILTRGIRITVHHVCVFGNIFFVVFSMLLFVLALETPRGQPLDPLVKVSHDLGIYITVSVVYILLLIFQMYALIQTCIISGQRAFLPSALSQFSMIVLTGGHYFNQVWYWAIRRLVAKLRSPWWYLVYCLVFSLSCYMSFRRLTWSQQNELRKIFLAEQPLVSVTTTEEPRDHGAGVSSNKTEEEEDKAENKHL